MTDEQVAHAVELYLSGQTLIEIAGQLKVGKTTVKRELVKAGVALREAHRRSKR